MEMASLVPFGVKWPATAALKDRRVRERAAFVEWIEGLDVLEDQRRVLSVLLGMVDDVELVDGRCAGVTYPAEVARRAGGLEDVEGILLSLEAAGHLSLHPAAEVFEDKRPGIVFRLRRPDVVLTVESAGPLWISDAWPRRSVAAVPLTRALARERAGNA
ncbi:hypothetical protein ABH924_005063 [Arthrobacter sp. GAS37]|uniref:hypothetical protein n=1 Tax=Arthrobacter sp. GAS37 TaxID=3156261 RepID=UPI0038370A97